VPGSPSKRLPANKTEGPFDLVGAHWTSASAKRKEFYIEEALRYWRTQGFPYYRLSPTEMASEFAAVMRVDHASVLRGSEIHGSNVGLRLANCFHPQMWSVRVSRYKTPLECFQDDDCFRTALRRSFSLWPDRHGASASCVRRILRSFSNGAAVSNFRPSVAKAVIEKYTKAGETVIDFSAGYGGRLLGSLALARTYIGIEPCVSQVRGLRKCVQAMQRLNVSPGSAEIVQGCAENVLAETPPRCAQLVFSSPPYFDWERYSTQRTQSFVRYPDYHSWVKGFLIPVVRGSRRVLMPGGFLVVNFPREDTRGPLLLDFKRISLESGFHFHREYKLRLSRVPYMHPRSGTAKWEALTVFRKV
jgi:hypothetical protein